MRGEWERLVEEVNERLRCVCRIMLVIVRYCDFFVSVVGGYWEEKSDIF